MLAELPLAKCLVAIKRLKKDKKAAPRWVKLPSSFLLRIRQGRESADRQRGCGQCSKHAIISHKG